MPSIYITAALTSVLALGVVGGLLLQRSPRDRHALLLVAVLLTLPMNPLAYYLVRLPLDEGVRALLPASSPASPWIRLLYAPLTEELAKLWPLLLPAFRRRVLAGPRVPVAMALGLGFGVGEIFFVASLVAQRADLAALPFWQFGGFVTERLLVCIMHGAFTATALVLLGRRFLLGLLAAMALHLVGNAPILIAAMDPIGLGKGRWQVVLSWWVMGYCMLMVALLSRYAYGRFGLRRLLLGRACCPLCGQVHQRPWLGFNMVGRRYERCPACRRWRWIREARDAVRDEEVQAGPAVPPAATDTRAD